jgi:hypothetical protein
MLVKVAIPKQIQFKIVPKLPDMLFGGQQEVHYIGGSEVLPPPLEPEEEAQAIEARNKALASSRALIEYEMVKTWDGKLPVQMLGNSPVPFLNLDGVKK